MLCKLNELAITKLFINLSQFITVSSILASGNVINVMNFNMHGEQNGFTSYSLSKRYILAEFE